MAQIDADLLERYQLDLQKNPRSRVFAPLAEAYRKMGLLDQALELCKQGVKHHPNFVSGRVAYGRICLEKGLLEQAEEELSSATRLSPDNLLAHRLLAKLYVQQRQPARALKSFKYVLLLHPKDEEARRFVQRWESMSAKDFTEALYDGDGPQVSEEDPQDLPKVLSIADAFIVRKEVEQAKKWLRGQSLWQGHPQVERRLKLLEGAPATERQVERKVRYLRKLLQRIETSHGL